LHGKTFPPHPIDYYFLQLLSLKPYLFQPRDFIVCLDGNQERSEWPCRLQSNPSHTTFDRVPPEEAILGFHRASSATGQELDGFCISTFCAI
jgi:hypothetical protein